MAHHKNKTPESNKSLFQVDVMPGKVKTLRRTWKELQKIGFYGLSLS
jgi:hypothetical protein